MISTRTQKQLEFDVTNFFGAFQSFEEKKKDGYDLTIGNIKGIKKIETILKDFSFKDFRALNSYPGTQGYMPLNEKLAKLTSSETKTNVEPEQIIITNGAFDAISHAVSFSCEVGERCFYSLPSFPYWSAIRRADCKDSCVIFHNLNDYKQKYGIAFKECVKKDKKIKSIIVCSPQNPMGETPNKNQLSTINETSVENNIEIIIDDVYRSFEDEWVGRYFNKDNVIIADSFSKRFALPGLRLGFVVVPEHKVKFFRANCANKVVAHSAGNLMIANELLEIFMKKNIRETIVSEINKRRITLLKEINELKNYDIDIVGKKGMYITLLIDKFCKMNKISCRNVIELLHKNKIKVLGCECFYPNFIRDKPRFVRLSVGGEDRVKEVGEKIVEVFREESR